MVTSCTSLTCCTVHQVFVWTSYGRTCSDSQYGTKSTACWCMIWVHYVKYDTYPIVISISRLWNHVKKHLSSVQMNLKSLDDCVWVKRYRHFLIARRSIKDRLETYHTKEDVATIISIAKWAKMDKSITRNSQMNCRCWSLTFYASTHPHTTGSIVSSSI